jgi:hypothetical protein
VLVRLSRIFQLGEQRLPQWIWARQERLLHDTDIRHSFKVLPNIGKHIVELLEDRLPQDFADAWRWRPGQGDALKSTRAARAKDLADMPGWKHDDDVDEITNKVGEVRVGDTAEGYCGPGQEM